MDPPRSSLEAGKENFYYLEDALSELFDTLLYVLTGMDVFGRSTSPSIFIVYAHDNNEGGSSGAQYAKCFIKWLLALRSRILSDKSPLRSKREGGIAAARNILSNQFCLLPPGRSTDGSGDEITSVDKVILCGSEVLQQYYRHAFTASYIAGIEDCYDKAKHRGIPPEGLRDEIRQFVEQQCQSEGFHHVLTELAFLALRRKAYGREDDGIIPVRLSGDEVSYVPFIAKCDLFLKINESPSMTMTGQHKLFFNLLRQLYADPNSHAIIDAFQDCYMNASKHLQKRVTMTRETFRRIAYKEIFKAQDIVLDSRTAGIRDEQWRQQWKGQTQSDFSRRDKILDWLPKFDDVTDTHRDNLYQRQDRTGSWILADERYQKWKAWVPVNSLSDERFEASRLWCYGKPGAGKTIISSVIIKDLQDHIFESSVAIAYIFCKHREEQAASSLILSLVAQLAHQRHQLSKELIKFAEKYRNRTALATPKFFECVETLHAEVRQFKKVFVVIDALDERLNDNHGYYLLDCLLNTNANVLVTSRNIGPIADMLAGAQSIEIAARPSDVTAYLNSRFQHTEAHRLRKLVKRNRHLQSLIVERLVSKTKGMFLLARMHMDLVINSVNHYPTEISAKKAVERLSSDLHEVYDEYIDRIFRSEWAEHAADALSWVLFAREPVPMRVIQEAIALRWPPKRIDNLIDGHDILGYCIGLIVEKGPPTNMVTFVHPDMERYFRDPSNNKKIQNWIPNGHKRIASSCLECLLLDDTEAQAKSPLWRYGAQHWGHHVQGKYAELQPLLSEYLSHSEKVSSAMQYSMKKSPPIPPRPRAHFGMGRKNEPFEYTYSHPIPSKCYGGHVASYFGISQYFDAACKKDIDRRDSNGWTPLWWAILGGQEAMVNRLLESGTDVDTRSNSNEPLAIWMLGVKHEMKPGYLIKGLECNNHKEMFQAFRLTPQELSYIDFIPRVRGFATEQSTLRIIKALSGEGLNARNDNGDTVLMTAARCWQCNLVRQLVHQGADISLRNHSGDTAFLQALRPREEHWRMEDSELSGKGTIVLFGLEVTLPLETTLDPYSFGTLESTIGEMLMTLIPKDMAGDCAEAQEALRLAIANRHPSVVSELLARGASPHWRYRDGYTPLTLSCMPPNILTFDISRVSIRDMAILNGTVYVCTKASTHARPFAEYESWHAGWRISHDIAGIKRHPLTDFDLIVRMLLDKGAEIDRDCNGKTALAIAAENEYLTIFRTLLEAGADILKVRYNVVLRLAEVLTQFEFSKGAYDKACFATLQDFQTHDYCVLLLGLTCPKGKFVTTGVKSTKGVVIVADLIDIGLPLQLSSGGKANGSTNIREIYTPRKEYERRVREKMNREPEELLDMICSKIEEATQRVRMADPKRALQCPWSSADIGQSWNRRRRAGQNMGSRSIILASGYRPMRRDTNSYRTISEPESSGSESPTDTAWQREHETFLQRWVQATNGLLGAFKNGVTAKPKPSHL